MDKNIVYLRHILLATGKINEYVNRGGRKLFDKDTAIQDALIKQIEIIGEATRKISEGFKKDYPGVPWKKMVGMRDKLVHDYMGVDFDIVWETAKNGLTPLKKFVQLKLRKKGKYDY